MRVTPLMLCAALALSAAGCAEKEIEPVSGRDAPAVTSPGSTNPYESGGSDGSGGDGRREKDDKGGVAAGRDSGSGG